jgi:hypothetical protein
VLHLALVGDRDGLKAYQKQREAERRGEGRGNDRIRRDGRKWYRQK